MKALLTKVFESFQEDFGHPVKLIRLLQDHPDICVSLNAPAPCIDAYSIAPWHELGESKHLYGPSRERGSLMGWKQRDKHSYGSFILHRPEYAQIAQRAIVEDWGCDITDVQGFAGSKSELRNFTSTDQMVETNSPDMIESISPAKLAENLAHREIRIIHAPGIDYFQRYAWDGRLFLINSGGSHHFAAAKYIAARLPQAVALRGKLVTHSLNALAIASLQRDYEMSSRMPRQSGEDFMKRWRHFGLHGWGIPCRDRSRTPKRSCYPKQSAVRCRLLPCCARSVSPTLAHTWRTPQQRSLRVRTPAIELKYENRP